MLRHVFGSELPPERFGARPDGQPWACTEWELHKAIEAAKQGLVKDVLVFRDTSSLVRTGKTPQQRDADTAELARVDDYLKRNPGQRPHEHEGVDGLRAMFPGLLDAWLDQYLKTPDAAQAAWTTPAEHLTPDQQALLDALLAEPEDPPPPDADRLRLTDAVKRTEVQGLRGYLLRRYAEWCSTEGGRLDRRFVRLTLLVNQGRDAEGEQFLLQGERGSFDRLDTLLARHAGVEGWVLVGEPGSGKSTLLQHHELRTARAALRALAHDPAARPEVCFWQRLSHFDRRLRRSSTTTGSTPCSDSAGGTAAAPTARPASPCCASPTSSGRSSSPPGGCAICWKTVPMNCPTCARRHCPIWPRWWPGWAHSSRCSGRKPTCGKRRSGR